MSKPFPYKTLIDRVITDGEGNIIFSKNKPGYVSTDVGGEDKPAFVKIVDKDGKLLFSNENAATVTVKNGSVEVTSLPQAKGASEILEGTCDPASTNNYPHEVAPSGASAIWIQAAPENTKPLRVTTLATGGFKGAYLQPGESEWFYPPSGHLYVSLNDGETEPQNFVFQSIKYA